MKRQNTEKGQALVLIILGIVALIGMTGLTIDGGNAYSDRRNAQNAADTSVLAAALANVNGQDYKSAALSRAASNGYKDTDPTSGSSSSTVNVEVYNPPIDGAYVGNSEYFEVIITSKVRTYFAVLFGIQQFTNHVEAIARGKPPITTQMFNGNAVVSLSPHDCKAFTYQGNADTKLIGSGIYVNSDCADSAFFNNSGAATLTAPSLCAVGGITYASGALNIPSITEGCQPEPIPSEPNPSCGSAIAQKNGNELSPGNWTGAFPPSGVTKLKSGIYCINGNFTLNGGDSLTSEDGGVVFRMDSGNVKWNGNATINLSAPNTPPFAGLLLFMPQSNPGTIYINGNSSSTISGTIMGFSADVTFDGSGGVTMDGQIIGYTVTLTGTSSSSINYNDNQNFDGFYPANIQLSQ